MPTDQASITTWNRLEPISRATDVADGVQARLLDPLWLLARQWQMCEFAGNDAGSPALSTLDVVSQPLESVTPPGGDPASGVPLADGLPLEVVVQREDPGDDQQAWLRSAAEAGAQFVRIVRGRGLGHLASAWVEAYQLGDLSASEEQLDPAAPSLRAVVGRRLPDGNAIASALAASLGPDRSGPLPARPRLPEDHGDELALREACAAFLDWCAASAPDPSPAGAPVFWRSDELRYAFSVTAGGADAPVRFDARALDGDRVDWWTFDLANAPERAAATETVEVVPTRVAFRGSPANRHWEVEDDAVDLGSVDAAPDGLVRLLLLQFALGFGRDWSLAPLQLPAGSVARIAGARVVDTFGRSVRVRHHGEVDGAQRTWRMFEHDRPDGAPIAGSLLLVPPALVGELHGEPIEDVLLMRDELAELAWAVERRVLGPSGRTVDRGQGSTDPPPVTPSEEDGKLRYVLEGHVPESWLPLLPQLDAATGQALLLRLGRVGSSPANPVGRLLAPAGDALTLREEELPREGVELHRRFRAARSAGGAAHLWVGRSRRTGRGEAASGLGFDSLEPPAAV